MYENNGFHQRFHDKTRVEKVINDPYHSDFELNHGTSYLPLSSVGKGSLTCSIEEGVERSHYYSYTHILVMFTKSP